MTFYLHKAVLILMFYFCVGGFHPLFATEYYVSTNGNDSNSGSLAQPWRTINKANNMVQAGDVVYILAGAYSESIKPRSSGNEGQYITYKNYAGEIVTIMNVAIGVNLNSKQYIRISGIRIISMNEKFVSIVDGHFNIVENCYMENAQTWGTVSLTDYSSYNRVMNNEIKRGFGDVIYLANGAHNNLVEGNKISGEFSTHACINLRGFVRNGDTLWVHHNIIRKNYVYDADDDNIGVTEYVFRNVIEGNRAVRSGLQFIREGDTPHGAGIKFTGAWKNIIRGNITVDNPTFGMGLYAQFRKGVHDPLIGNKFYNNVAYNNGPFNWNAAGFEIIAYYPENIFQNSFSNNIAYNNISPQIFIGGLRENLVKLAENKFVRNLIFSSSGSPDVKIVNDNYTYSQANDLSYGGVDFIDNFVDDPLFSNANASDFHLMAGSPAIDNGVFLTHTLSSGSGTTMRVADAGYFIDGFGITEGDIIQLEGRTERAVITRVDYTKNELILATPLSWNQGQGVSLSYFGAGPDIGAYEYAGVSSLGSRISGSPLTGQIPLTVNFSGRATGGTLPYSYSWDFGNVASSSEKNPMHTFTEAKQYTVTFTVADGNGDQDQSQIIVTPFEDITPPTGTILINNGSESASSTAITLTLSAEDHQSGMGVASKMQFSNDNVTWSDPVQYTNISVWKLTDGNGQKIVYAKFMDNAGNWMAQPARDEIILDTSRAGYLVYTTFEQSAEGWGDAIGNTSYRLVNSTAFKGSYSMQVYATGPQSKLSIGNSTHWNIDNNLLSFAYKVPENVPVGIFVRTDAGWLCLGGSTQYDPGGYSVIDTYRLLDDNQWHSSTLDIKDAVRTVYPDAKTILEFEWYTQNNGNQGDEFWFDEFKIFSRETNSDSPAAPKNVEISIQP